MEDAKVEKGLSLPSLSDRGIMSRSKCRVGPLDVEIDSSELTHKPDGSWSTADSGNGSDHLENGGNYYEDPFGETRDGEQDNVSEIEKSAEYYRWQQQSVELVHDNLKDGKKIITNPGWHAGKPDFYQIPLNMESKQCEPGYGWEGDTCCQKCGLYCGVLCGCPSVKTLRIGTIRVAARVVMIILTWAFFWAVTFPPCAVDDGSNNTDNTTTTSNDTLTCVIPGLPGTSLFGILMVFLFGMIAESLIVLIPLPGGLPPLPPLLGSLLVGLALRNIPGIKFGADINEEVSSRLRNMALGIILGRAGLEVDKKQMYKLRWVVPRIAFLPCIIEACSYGVFAHFILELPWIWSFLLGFVCGAVAPACVVPSMIKFQEEGLGTDHGVPSLLIAGASIDDIVAINVFNILLIPALATEGDPGIGYSIGIAFAEIFGGIILGCIGGFFLQKFPDRRQHNIVRDRTFLLILISFFYIFATDGPIDLAGAGTLGTLVCSFIAAIGWQLHQTEPVAHNFKSIWFYFQPLLFGLTGATVDISLMEGPTVARAILTMLICLTIRLTVAGNAVSFLGWSHKEKLMTAISWIPKATVQAAIGGTALAKVQSMCGDNIGWLPCNYNATSTNETCIEDSCYCPGTFADTCQKDNAYALIILQVSVLLIIITAPVGVFLIGLAGPKLLPKAQNHNNGEGEKTPNEIENGSIGDANSDVLSVKKAEPAGQTNKAYEVAYDGDTKGDFDNTRL